MEPAATIFTRKKIALVAHDLIAFDENTWQRFRPDCKAYLKRIIDE